MVFDGKPTELQAMSRMHNAVKINFSGEVPAAAKEALSNIDEISDVVLEDGTQSLIAMPKNGVSIVSQVTHLVREKSWDAEEVFVTTGQLDEVFREITTHNNPVPDVEANGDLS